MKWYTITRRGDDEGVTKSFRDLGEHPQLRKHRLALAKLAVGKSLKVGDLTVTRIVRPAKTAPNPTRSRKAKRSPHIPLPVLKNRLHRLEQIVGERTAAGEK